MEPQPAPEVNSTKREAALRRRSALTPSVGYGSLRPESNPLSARVAENLPLVTRFIHFYFTWSPGHLVHPRFWKVHPLSLEHLWHIFIFTSQSAQSQNFTEFQAIAQWVLESPYLDQQALWMQRLLGPSSRKTAKKLWWMTAVISRDSDTTTTWILMVYWFHSPLHSQTLG